MDLVVNAPLVQSVATAPDFAVVLAVGETITVDDATGAALVELGLAVTSDQWSDWEAARSAPSAP